MANILSFPAFLRQKSSPYFSILGNALRQQGVNFRDYKILLPYQQADVLHLHWPERLYNAQAVKRHRSLSDYAFRNMIATADRIQQSGGRFVWTAHNLKPHEPPPARHAHVWERWHDALIGRVDSVVCMTESAKDVIRQAVPAARDAEFIVAPHPHYRSLYTQWDTPAQTRRAYGVPEGATLTAMLGFVRRYKGIKEAVELFRRLDPDRHVLVIGGKCLDPQLRAELEAAAAASPNIRIVLRPLSDRELASLYKASDLALFNFTDILNSGSVLTALSLDVPCLAPRRGAIADVHRDVGAWCEVFDAALDVDTLVAALSRPRPEGRPNLDRYEPAQVARLHLRAYGLTQDD